MSNINNFVKNYNSQRCSHFELIWPDKDKLKFLSHSIGGWENLLGSPFRKRSSDSYKYNFTVALYETEDFYAYNTLKELELNGPEFDIKLILYKMNGHISLEVQKRVRILDINAESLCWSRSSLLGYNVVLEIVEKD